ncbi:MAG TPA: helix-turn-helix domain-containing protein, partial [Micromonosporaceae bacterium]
THPDEVRRVIGARLPGGGPTAALVAATVDRLLRDAHRYPPTEATRLSVTVVDLIGVLLASALGGTDPTGWPAHHRTLLLRIQAHIEARLDDPALCPTGIAAAHHIGLRTLHRVFGAQGLTVSGWIRHRRLERCRRALVDPLSLGQPIYALASRYGFADGAHLTRTFHAAYGVTPQTYRQSWLSRIGDPAKAAGTTT